jgi:translation initiation factor 1
VAKDKKKLNLSDLGGMLYSTNPDFDFDAFNGGEEENETLPPDKQKLLVSKSTKQRGGKIATLITGFEGSDEDLQELSKKLKTRCGVGGSAKENEIIIQGDVKQKVLEYLLSLGYKAKLGN